MNPRGRGPSDEGGARTEIRSLAGPLEGQADLDRLVERCAGARFVCVGEASHGTHEYYRWRALLSRRLVEEHGFAWIGVEGDWPDCWRLDRWVRGRADQDLDARSVLDGFERWPTWMWANEEVAEFLDWLREENARRPSREQVGFYGLDVYSLWDSLREIVSWLERSAPEALPVALRAWQCFVPFHEDPHEYARSMRIVPESCEADVVALLAEVRRRALDGTEGDPGALDDALNATLNAMVAVDAERYYRTMVRGDRPSWNVRDEHMAEIADMLSRHHGPGSKGLVWEHNSHVGDARATDMLDAGLVSVGQLLRERHARQEVVLVGLASWAGTVVASEAWGAAEEVLAVPEARPGTHEDLLHRSLGAPALLVFGPDRSGPWLSARLGHRAVGVVYHPRREAGNYVPTRMGERYDALLWFEVTVALRPLHHEGPPRGPELETAPTGY
ncbi:erythromycin esterase family protein [Kocuria sp. M1N1S27]|uniref:erythromycin esterase family protein n=1 Tax=Kocuria kalidii TaxID=3376283 RepID=UPI00379DDF94